MTGAEDAGRAPGPTADASAALARSSPWQWTTLRSTARLDLPGRRATPVRARLRRPDLLRVEDLAGGLLQVVRQHPDQVSVLTAAGGRTATLPHPWAAGVPGPRLRPDGLVAQRPGHVSFDAPLYRSYTWVALLDPVELADGRDPDTGAPAPGADVAAVARVEHGGRPAWEAVLRPTAGYEARCSGCSLLRSRDVDERLLASGGPGTLLDAYPTATRVRLDAATGVCVLVDDVDGALPGPRVDVRIEAVDEPLDDALFPRA